MKCLLLVYGEYRSGDIATKSWNILNNNVDVIVHTQNVSRQKINKNEFDFREIGKKDLYNIFDDCKLYIESIDNFKYINPNDDINLNIRSFRYLYKKVCDYILDYDLVAISRLDSTFYIHDFEKFINEYKKDILYVTQKIVKNNNGNFIQDHCFFGSSKVISSFLKNLPDKVLDSHHEIADYILENFKHDVWTGFSSIHLRFNMIKLFERFFQNNGRCKNKDDNYLNFFSNFMREKHFELEAEIK